MLGYLGLITMVVLIVLIMTKKVSPLLALLVTPIVACIIAGQGAELSGYITTGLKNISPTAVMFIFAVLFFGILTDAGTFDPIVNKIVKIAGNNPIKITLGTAILAMIIHLDGSGAVTFMVAIPAVLPLYDRLGMSKVTLATIVGLSAGVMNMLPWGGPTIRAATALDVPVMEVFTPLLIPMISGIIMVLITAFVLGKQEQKRISQFDINLDEIGEIAVSADASEIDPEKAKLLRPKLFIPNVILIIVTIAIMIKAIVPVHVAFIIGFSVAIILNYPSSVEQRKRINAHAVTAMLMATMIFAAGVYSGILKGSGMIEAVSQIFISIIPASLAKFTPIIIGIIGVPLGLFIDIESWSFGILPALANSLSSLGVDSMSIARAALLGNGSIGFPVSPLVASAYILVGLSGIEFGDLQKKMLPIAWGISILMIVISVIAGVIII